MKCPKCGKESEGNFCQFCGAKFSNRPADQKGADDRTVHIGPASGIPGRSSSDHTVKGQDRVQNDRPVNNGAPRGGSAYGGPGSLGGNLQSDRRPGAPGSGGSSSGSSGRPDRNTIYVGIMVTITAVLVVLFIALAMAVFGKKNKDDDSSDTAITSQEDSAAEASSESETPPAEEPGKDASKDSSKDTNKDTNKDTTTEPVQQTPSQDQASESDDKQTYPKPDKLPDHKFSYNGHTYGFYDAKEYSGLDSYDAVEAFCEKQGGHLAVIGDKNENDKLFNALSGRYTSTAFFGYSDVGQEGRWVWVYGTNNYENWTNNARELQPDNGYGWGGDEDVAEFNYDGTKDDIINDGTWNDAPFRQNTSLFICEWEYDWLSN